MLFNGITILAVMGLLVSIYALYVEKKDERTARYKPLCDINKRVSCTKALTSRYGKLLRISNSIIGIIFYIILLITGLMGKIELIFYIMILSMFPTAYLAYLSYAKLKLVCIICTSIYVINIALLVASYKLL